MKKLNPWISGLAQGHMQLAMEPGLEFVSPDYLSSIDFPHPLAQLQPNAPNEQLSIRIYGDWEPQGIQGWEEEEEGENIWYLRFRIFLVSGPIEER